jgi:hypothetical protein
MNQGNHQWDYQAFAAFGASQHRPSLQGAVTIGSRIAKKSLITEPGAVATGSYIQQAKDTVSQLNLGSGRSRFCNGLATWRHNFKLSALTYAVATGSYIQQAKDNFGRKDLRFHS